MTMVFESRMMRWKKGLSADLFKIIVALFLTVVFFLMLRGIINVIRSK